MSEADLPNIVNCKKDYYSILGITLESTEAQVRAAYLRLALRWHPDKHIGNVQATSKFADIGEAYHVLSDNKLRAKYDASSEYEVKALAVEEYLTRFKYLILTVNGLGLNPGDPEPEARCIAAT